MSDPKSTTTVFNGDGISSDKQAMVSLLVRRELWLLVSTAFVDPFHREQFGALMDPAFRTRAIAAAAFLRQEYAEADLEPSEVGPEQLAPEALFDALDALDAGPQGIEAAYRQLFGVTGSSELCPPCETEYEPNTELVYRCQRFADVAGFYRAFGVQIAPLAGERMDHITAETEFLYLLLSKQVAALQEGNEEGFEVSKDAHREFFQQHLGWWMPAFTRLLAGTAPPGFYRELAALTAALSALERVSLSLPRFEVPAVPKPSEDACAECMGSQSVS